MSLYVALDYFTRSLSFLFLFFLFFSFSLLWDEVADGLF